MIPRIAESALDNSLADTPDASGTPVVSPPQVGDSVIPPSDPHPVLDFWHRITRKASENFDKIIADAKTDAHVIGETAKALVRGPALAGIETARTLDEALGVDPAKARAKADAAKRMVGPASDNGFARVVEGLAQASTPAILTAPLTGGSSLLSRVAVGAASLAGDGIVLDPDAPQLGEFIAQAGPAWSKPLGDFLSAKPDDNRAWLRAKRALPGAVVGATLAGASRLLKRAPVVAVDEATNRLMTTDGTHIGPEFANVADAHLQASTLNDALEAKATAGALDPEATALVSDDLSKALSGNKQAVSDFQTTPVGVTYHTSGDQAVDLAEKLSREFKAKIDAHVAEHGAVSLDEQSRIALEGISSVPEGAAHGVLKAGLERAEGLSAWNAAAEKIIGDYSADIERLGKSIDMRPGDPILMQEGRTALTNYLDASAALKASRSETGRALGRGGKAATAAVQSAADQVAGMTDEEVANTLRLMRATPASVPKQQAASALGTALKIYQKGMNTVFSYYVNSLLSSPSTGIKIAASGKLLSHAESFFKVLGGAAFGNSKLSQEGLDQLMGLWRYTEEGVKTAGMAARAGHSIVDPHGLNYASLPFTPSAIAGAADELNKVPAIRANLFAKAMREGRELGMSGDALLRYADQTTDAAFDPSGALAHLPSGELPSATKQALDFGRQVTLSTPVGADSWWKPFDNAVQNDPTRLLQFVFPFRKSSVNTLKYVFKDSNPLTLLNGNILRAARAGDEAAQASVARIGTATMLAGGAYAAANKGYITGSGPSDPQVRKVWLQSNQPNSLRVNGRFYSYASTDLAPLLSVAATLNDVALNRKAHIYGDDGAQEDHDQLATAMVLSVAHSVFANSYMQGLPNLLDALTTQDEGKITKLLAPYAQAAVPRGLKSVWEDPYLRETVSIGDKVRDRIPGFSKHFLEPRYGWDGQPQIALTDTWSSMGNKPAKADSDIEDTLMQLGVAWPTRSPMLSDNVDMRDPKYADKRVMANASGDALSPYSYFNSILAEGDKENGVKPLRQQVKEYLKSSDYAKDTGGLAEFPGGRRVARLNQIRSDAMRDALSITLAAYPQLAQDAGLEKDVKKAAKEGLSPSDPLVREYRNRGIQKPEKLSKTANPFAEVENLFDFAKE